MPLRIGDDFAGYHILRLVGSGGTGEVYLASIAGSFRGSRALMPRLQ